MKAAGGMNDRRQFRPGAAFLSGNLRASSSLTRRENCGQPSSRRCFLRGFPDGCRLPAGEDRDRIMPAQFHHFIPDLIQIQLAVGDLDQCLQEPS